MSAAAPLLLEMANLEPLQGPALQFSSWVFRALKFLSTERGVSCSCHCFPLLCASPDRIKLNQVP